jgi:hypothetical protein
MTMVFQVSGQEGEKLEELVMTGPWVQVVGTGCMMRCATELRTEKDHQKTGRGVTWTSSTRWVAIFKVGDGGHEQIGGVVLRVCIYVNKKE